jgi:hypothetical protein
MVNYEGEAGNLICEVQGCNEDIIGLRWTRGMCKRHFNAKHRESKQSTEKCADCSITDNSTFSQLDFGLQCRACTLAMAYERKRNTIPNRVPKLMDDFCTFCIKVVRSEFSGRVRGQNRICAGYKSRRPNPNAPYGPENQPMRQQQGLQQSSSHGYGNAGISSEQPPPSHQGGYTASSSHQQLPIAQCTTPEDIGATTH